MKYYLAIIGLLFSLSACSQEVQLANIVSVTPLTDQVQVSKLNCVPVQQSSSIFGDMFGTSTAQENCRQIQTLEPVAGGYQVVYELGGQQYTVRSNSFPRGKTIKVQMRPAPIQN